MKQWKKANDICSINDAKGTRVDGSSVVAKTLTEFYQKLLGEQKIECTHISQEIIATNPVLTIEQ